MQRGKPLQRRTPLASGKPLAGGAPLRRTELKRTPMKRTAPKARKRAPADVEQDALWAAVRLILHVRSGGMCELCGTPISVASMEGHHRRSRGVPGDHRHCPCNALALCGACHHGPKVHAGPALAMELGTIISRHSTTVPADVVVQLRHGKVALDCGGAFLCVA